MSIFSWTRKKNNDAYLIVGLGNFPDRYKGTRHNAGFVAVQALADAHHMSFKKHKCHAAVAQADVEGVRVIAAKPLTYMNNSGEAVGALLRFYKLPVERLVVLYDDIDLPDGTLRIRPSGSAGTHNGMRSILQHVQSENFARVRIGVGAPPKGGDLVKFVMSPLSPEAIEAAHRAALAVEDLVQNGVQHAMSRYNAKAGKA